MSEKRMNHGLQLGLSIIHLLPRPSTNKAPLGLFYNGNNPSPNLRSGYGNSDFDRTHVMNFTYLYHSPKICLGNFVDGQEWLTAGA